MNVITKTRKIESTKEGGQALVPDILSFFTEFKTVGLKEIIRMVTKELTASWINC
jgi:hypothetical protein